MPKTTPATRKIPSLQAIRRSIASSTALETGQNIQQLEKKLQSPIKLRFQHVKLAS